MRTTDTLTQHWRSWHMAGAFLMGAFCALVLTRGLGFLGSMDHPMEEARLCYAALSTPRVIAKLQPQTREYLKGRLYWNAAVWIRHSDELDDWHIDFGPVDTSQLQGVLFSKEPMSGEDIYRAALSRHPRAATSIYTW